jgi:hypothetical protein
VRRLAASLAPWQRAPRCRLEAVRELAHERGEFEQVAVDTHPALERARARVLVHTRDANESRQIPARFARCPRGRRYCLACRRSSGSPSLLELDRRNAAMLAQFARAVDAPIASANAAAAGDGRRLRGLPVAAPGARRRARLTTARRRLAPGRVARPPGGVARPARAVLGASVRLSAATACMSGRCGVEGSLLA